MSTSGIRYLLAIEELSLNGAVRSKDVAEKLSLTRASVCRAVDRLSEERCVVREESGALALTEKGKIIVRRYERCIRKIREMLIRKLNCRESVAERDAINVACAFSEENIDKILELSVQEV